MINAFFLATGLGNRLHQKTNDDPKCMVPVGINKQFDGIFLTAQQDAKSEEYLLMNVEVYCDSNIIGGTLRGVPQSNSIVQRIERRAVA